MISPSFVVSPPRKKNCRQNFLTVTRFHLGLLDEKKSKIRVVDNDVCERNGLEQCRGPQVDALGFVRKNTVGSFVYSMMCASGSTKGALRIAFDVIHIIHVLRERVAPRLLSETQRKTSKDHEGLQEQQADAVPPLCRELSTRTLNTGRGAVKHLRRAGVRASRLCLLVVLQLRQQ